jgi:hypothetical protein
MLDDPISVVGDNPLPVGIAVGVLVGWVVRAGEALPLPKSLPKENRSTSKDVYIILILTQPVI